MPHLVCTASNDRNLRIWDVRHLSKIKPLAAETIKPPKSEDGETRIPTNPTSSVTYERTLSYRQEAKGKGLLRASFEHGKSCSAAYWDPSGRRILTTSYDDKLRSESVKVIANTSLDAQPPKLCAGCPAASFTLQAEPSAASRLSDWAVADHPACPVVEQHGLPAALYGGKHEAYPRRRDLHWREDRQAVGRGCYRCAVCYCESSESGRSRRWWQFVRANPAVDCGWRVGSWYACIHN